MNWLLRTHLLCQPCHNNIISIDIDTHCYQPWHALSAYYCCKRVLIIQCLLVPTLSQQCCRYQPCGSSVSIKPVCDCGLAIEHCQCQLRHNISIKPVCDCGLAIEHCQHQLRHISVSYVTTSASSLSVIVDLPLNIVSISYVTALSVWALIYIVCIKVYVSASLVTEVLSSISLSHVATLLVSMLLVPTSSLNNISINLDIHY